MEENWYTEFFDRLYYETYSPFESEERNRKEAEFIAKALEVGPGDTLLDLACGYGRHAIVLSEMGYRVIGLDISDTLIGIARNIAAKKNITEDRLRFIKGDMRQLPWAEMFDGVYCFYTSFGYFSHEDNHKVLMEAYRVLKPEKRFLLDIWNRERMIKDFSDRYWYEAGDYIILEARELDLIKTEIRAKRIFIKDGERVERVFRVKFYSAREIREMFGNAGFREVKFYGDYQFNEYTKDSPRMIVLAQK